MKLWPQARRLAPALLLTLISASCASTRDAPLPATKNGKPVISLPADCERLPGAIAKTELKKGDDAKVHVVRRGGIIDKLNARIKARDKCASATRGAFGGVP